MLTSFRIMLSNKAGWSYANTRRQQWGPAESGSLPPHTKKSSAKASRDNPVYVIDLSTISTEKLARIISKFSLHLSRRLRNHSSSSSGSSSETKGDTRRVKPLVAFPTPVAAGATITQEATQQVSVAPARVALTVPEDTLEVSDLPILEITPEQSARYVSAGYSWYMPGFEGHMRELMEIEDQLSRAAFGKTDRMAISGCFGPQELSSPLPPVVVPSLTPVGVETAEPTRVSLGRVAPKSRGRRKKPGDPLVPA